jgi:hypothetical protein
VAVAKRGERCLLQAKVQVIVRPHFCTLTSVDSKEYLSFSIVSCLLDLKVLVTN